MAKKEKKNQVKKNAVKNPTRRLFAIDIENIIGKPVLAEEDVAKAKEKLVAQFGIGRDDMVLIGATHTSNFMNIKYAWGDARTVWAPNHDGADLAIIKALGDYKLDTFAEMFMMSGDGIFGGKVKEMLSDIPVTVVSRKRALSKKLAAAAPVALVA